MPLQPGDCVEVFGLESEKGKELNGKRGILTKHFEAKGRFEVRLTPDRSVNVKPDNLQKVELTVAERLRILGLGGTSENEESHLESAPRARSRSRDRTRSTCADEKPHAHGPADTEPDLPFKPGHCVEVVGLESEAGSQLNGQTGIVASYIAETKRFEIRLSEKTVSLKAENLQKREFKIDDFVQNLNSNGVESKHDTRSRSRSSSSSSSSSPSESPLRPEQVPEPFSLGDRVEIFGLESAEGRPLNGRFGTIVTYLKAKSRFEVRIEPDDMVRNLKPANLKKCAGDAESNIEHAPSQPPLESKGEHTSSQPDAPKQKAEQVPPAPAGTSLSSLLGLGRVEQEVKAEPASWQSVWSRSGGGKVQGIVLSQEEVETFNALQEDEEKREDEITALKMQVKAELVSAGAYCDEMFEQVFEERLKEHQLMKALRPQGESKETSKRKRSASRSSSSSSSSRSSASKASDKKDRKVE
mmetsp:Transcript_13554/g.22357  ORF Transcript_13554/g.22357 Transcript_13554/m.22357 type:complete len:471 (-) Transcript_13554:36-1448(-)